MKITLNYGGKDLPAIEIPVNPSDFTKPNIDALRGVLIPQELAAADLVVWTGVQDWLQAMTTTNGPPPSVLTVVNSIIPARWWSLRNWNIAQNPTVVVNEFKRDAAGAFVPYSIVPASGGSVGQNPPETLVQPGQLTDANQPATLGSVALLMLATHGGWFSDDGIPTFQKRGYSTVELLSPNFGGQALGFTQLPMNAVGFGPWPTGWFPFFVPGSARTRIAIAKVDDIARLPQKPVGGTAATSTGMNYANSTDAVGAFAIAMATVPGATPSGVGPAIAGFARQTV